MEEDSDIEYTSFHEIGLDDRILKVYYACHHLCLLCCYHTLPVVNADMQMLQRVNADFCAEEDSHFTHDRSHSKDAGTDNR